MPPSCVTDEAIVEKYSSEYMYLEAIKFINIVRLESRGHSVDKNGILRSAQPITVQPHQDAVVEEDQHSSSTLLGSRSTGKVPCDATPAIRYHFPHDLDSRSGSFSATAEVCKRTSPKRRRKPQRHILVLLSHGSGQPEGVYRDSGGSLSVFCLNK